MGAKVATFEQCYNAEKRRRLLFNLLYPHRKTLGKELGNLGKTSGILGTPSAHSWEILTKNYQMPPQEAHCRMLQDP